VDENSRNSDSCFTCLEFLGETRQVRGTILFVFMLIKEAKARKATVAVAGIFIHKTLPM
jgi:hypothetical protein